MIKEAKSLVSDLVAAITPASLATNDIHAIDVTGSYDWNTQSYCYDACKFDFPTFNQTHNQTCSGSWNGVDDNPSDSYQD